MRARNLVVGLVSRFEQEIRAYPRAYDLFYRGVTRSPRVRALVGRAKDRVRLTTGAARSATEEPSDDPLVAAARQEAAARRLGLSP